MIQDGTATVWPPKDIDLSGRFTTLTRLKPPHVDELWSTISSPEVVQAKWWEYIYTPPFSYEILTSRMKTRMARENAVYYGIIDHTSQKTCGWVCLNQVDLVAGTASVGIFLPSPAMQGTPRATEALFLLLQSAFGTLELETVYWKTDSLNEGSCRAAERLGFELHNAQKDAFVVDGVSRDETTYVLSREKWALESVVVAKWLEPGNFDEYGKQRRKLKSFHDGQDLTQDVSSTHAPK